MNKALVLKKIKKKEKMKTLDEIKKEEIKQYLRMHGAKSHS